MIVLDEQLQGLDLEKAISRWYRGAIFLVNDLRLQTLIKDDSIPALLRRAKKSTFITINYSDFWLQTQASSAYCVVCFKLLTREFTEIPFLLRRLLSLPEFKTKKARMGKVISVTHSRIKYYEKDKNRIHTIMWQ